MLIFFAVMKIMSIFAPVRFEYAQMAELVDALDSKSSAARRAGSIPALGTIKELNANKALNSFCF